MIDIAYISAYVLAAFFAAIAATFSVAGATHYTKGRNTGWLQYYFYAVFFHMTVIAVFSNRELTAATAELATNAPTGPSAITNWVSRFVSVFLVVSSLERIFSVWLSRTKRTKVAAVLAFSFVILWITTVASPAFLSPHGGASHDIVYPLLIGWAVIQFSALECSAALVAARNGTLLFVLLGYLFLPIKPRLVIETGYTQGYIPGLPRFAGLAPHAVSLGLLVQVALLLLWDNPYRRTWINRIAWLLGLSALFLAQSKTAWLSFVLSVVIMLVYRNGSTINRRLFDPTRPTLVIGVVAVFVFGVLATAGVLVWGNLGTKLINFLDSAEGNQLMTLTGRDQIWAIALSEFNANPILGYGANLFSFEYRLSIGLLNAGHGHNQLMDTLGRSGLVGTVPLLIYFVLLTVYSFKYAMATRGLSLAIYVVLAFRCVSEVPLSVATNGHEFAAHLTLLLVIVGAALAERKVVPIKSKRPATPLWATA
jgi:O-antigen ligase